MLIARTAEYGFVIEARLSYQNMNLAHMGALSPWFALAASLYTHSHVSRHRLAGRGTRARAVCERACRQHTGGGWGWFLTKKKQELNHRPVRGIYKETTAAGPFARSHRTGGKNSRQVTRDLPAPCFRALQAEGVCRPEGLCPDLTFN